MSDATIVKVGYPRRYNINAVNIYVRSPLDKGSAVIVITTMYKDLHYLYSKECM